MLHTVLALFPAQWPHWLSWPWWPQTGRGYAFFSSLGSDITQFAVFAIAWRWANCHTYRCWRLGTHHVEGTSYRTCRRHHPNVPTRRRHLTAAHIAEAHAKATNEPRR